MDEFKDIRRAQATLQSEIDRFKADLKPLADMAAQLAAVEKKIAMLKVLLSRNDRGMANKN